MTAHDEALVERAAEALNARRCVPVDATCVPCARGTGCVGLARAVLDAVAPAIEARALRSIGKMFSQMGMREAAHHCGHCADRIEGES